MGEFKTYTFKKGTHKSRPIVMDSLRLRHKVQSREFECMLTKSCIYIFRKDGSSALHPDQWDFSKLRGNSHCVLDNHINSYMGAWRWDPVNVQFDLTSYFHVNGERYISPGRVQILDSDNYTPLQAVGSQRFTRFPGQLVKSFDSLLHYKLLEKVQVMATVVPNEPFRYRLLTDWDNMRFGVGFKATSTHMLWRDDWTGMLEANVVTRDILHWFGGNMKAPHKMQLKERKM